MMKKYIQTIRILAVLFLFVALIYLISLLGNEEQETEMNINFSDSKYFQLSFCRFFL